MRGFFIKKISARGNDIRPATIILKKGANLITGASDTGKSYIFSIINYVLGRSKVPKEIPESVGYHDFYLEIESFKNNSTYTLYRKISTDKIIVKECDLEKFQTSNKTIGTYKAIGTSIGEKNLSEFLMDHCDLSERKLLRNKTKGLTQLLSFKNILQLTSIAEDRIITEDSPFYPSNQVIARIPEQSLLKLLLTKKDFSDIVEKEDKEKKEISINGKIEYISSLLSRMVERRETVLKETITETNASYDKETILNLDKQLSKNLAQAKELLKRKRRLANIRDPYNSKLNYTYELLNRFTILQNQYQSDTKRLDFISEAEDLSTQLGDVVCPICTSPLDSNHINHVIELENFKNAISEEILKIGLKVNDLNLTINQLNLDAAKYLAVIRKIDVELDEVEKRLTQNLNPEISKLQANLKGYLKSENLNSEISFIDTEILKLYASKSKLEQFLNQKTKDEEIAILEFSELLDLSKFIEKRLKNWKYESHVNVIFDTNYKIFDIVISGKSRRSYGKGKRSISYTACLLGILDYCLKHNHPFSNLIVLDSPLTTFEEKKGKTTDEKLNDSILSSFFIDLASTKEDCQIIIFDNKIPKDLSKKGLNTIIFTGDNQTGREGFFTT